MEVISAKKPVTANADLSPLGNNCSINFINCTGTKQ